MTIFEHITETSNIRARHDAKYWQVEAPATGYHPARLIEALVKTIVRLFERASR
ncbi:hypothetical protein [Devosia sp.]|uniref:hypothetical protein n=1 Tax=Devosia sp. TaxID=1871048 RepID=UPI0032632363